MEVSAFLKLLYRQRLVLLLVPLVTIVITFFLVKNLPDTYVSNTQISTGITDKSANILSGVNGQELSVNQEFSNLLEIIQLPRILDQVSYQLMIHDLTSKTPFAKPSNFLKDLNSSARKHAIEVYANKYEKMEALSLWDNDQRGLHNLLESMGYDAASLSKNLTISRADYSDFIKIEFESHNPELSAFVVNSLSKEFISYNNLQLKANQYKAVNFLRKLLQEKRSAMNKYIEELKEYKIRNRVLNLDEQAKVLYEQIAAYETKREELQKSIVSSKGAIKSIDEKFDPKDRKYLESTMTKINTEINSTKKEIQELNDKYIQSNFNDNIKSSIDSLKNILTEQINTSTDKYIFNPMVAKQSLIAKKLSLEVDLDLAKNSVISVGQELVRLNIKFDSLVPHEAVVQGFESNIDISSKEYLEILNKYNQVSMEAGYSTKLNQVRLAMPGTIQPSKKMLLVILSGIISFIFCLVVLFILFFLDDSIKNARTLTDKTQLTTLGYLNFIHGSAFDLNKIWNSEDVTPEVRKYKDLLRSIRFEIDREIVNQKVNITITSLAEREGKTLFALNLAYAYAKINKKVLLIDGNFANSSISQNTHPKLYIEDYLQNNYSATNISSNEKITIFGNKGADVSILELASETEIRKKLDALKADYDIIITDVASLSNLDRAKEWAIFSDKVVAVFEYGKTLSPKRKDEIPYLQSLGRNFVGWVMNKTVVKNGKLVN